MSNNFQEKFKGQIKVIGKNGIAGTMANDAIQPIDMNMNMNAMGMYPYYQQQQQPMNYQQMYPQQNAWVNVYEHDNQVKTTSKNNMPTGSSHQTSSINNNLVSNGEMIMKSNNNNMNYNNRYQYNMIVPNQINPMQMMNMPNQPNQMYQQQHMQPMSSQINYPQNQQQQPTPIMKANKHISSNPKENIHKYIEYKPYTLKDYKELTRTAIVMGPLGANTGTKEWEEKKAKMKRMESYSNRINQTHKGITRLKKDSPQEEIEKILKKKKEASNRYKTYEYGKLIRPFKSSVNSRIVSTNDVGNSNSNRNNDYFFEDLGVINEKEEMKFKEQIDVPHINVNKMNNPNYINQDDNFIPISKAANKSDNVVATNNDYGNDNYDLALMQQHQQVQLSEGNQIANYEQCGDVGNFNMNNNEFSSNNQFIYNQESNVGNNNEQNQLEELMKQNELYQGKINEIKNSLI